MSLDIPQSKIRLAPPTEIRRIVQYKQPSLEEYLAIGPNEAPRKETTAWQETAKNWDFIFP